MLRVIFVIDSDSATVYEQRKGCYNRNEFCSLYLASSSATRTQLSH